MLVALVLDSNGAWVVRAQRPGDFSGRTLVEAAEDLARGLKFADGDQRLLVIHTLTGRVVEFRPPSVSWQLYREMWRTV
jgi:hypothetical protein